MKARSPELLVSGKGLLSITSNDRFADRVDTGLRCSSKRSNYLIRALVLMN